MDEFSCLCGCGSKCFCVKCLRLGPSFYCSSVCHCSTFVSTVTCNASVGFVKVCVLVGPVHLSPNWMLGVCVVCRGRCFTGRQQWSGACSWRLSVCVVCSVCVWSVGAGASQGGSSDQVLAHHGSSSSLASSSACSVQSSSTEKNVDNLSMRDGRCEDGRSVWLFCGLRFCVLSADTELCTNFTWNGLHIWCSIPICWLVSK